ncbi:hypothetical protein ASPNIDRAFT_139705, partial [Aspergillus niger ATCC 1015]
RTIVIAVDFGTTYSGIAWGQMSDPDTHYIINQWPQNTSDTCDGLTSEKVPSEVTYEYTKSGKKCLWGFQILDSMPRVQWIKLGLVPDHKLGVGSRLSATYNDCRRIPVPYHSSPEDVVTDYLRCLREHAVDILKLKLGSSLDSTGFEFVITVPAIWSDKAKMTTMSCAEKAGFGEASKVRIVSEPEAAAIHSLRASSPHGLEVGDTIVLCDAGGGTVDLITFTIIQLSPNMRLKERAPGTGSLCGSTFVNRRFEELLNDRLSSLPGWDRDTLDEAMHRFETVAKRTFSGNTDDYFMFPVPGIADSQEVGVRRGRFRVTGQEMQQLFLPILRDIEDLVREQIETSDAQSPYLRTYLRDCFSPEVEVIAPADGWTAVVRGALTKTLGEVSDTKIKTYVDSRKARENYGMICSTRFIDKVHDAKKKYWNDKEGMFYIDVMHWFVSKGDDIEEAKAIKTNWFQHKLAKDGTFDSIRVNLYRLDTPMVIDISFLDVKQHAKLNPILNQIEKNRIPICHGADNELYYTIGFQIHAVYYSAHCEYMFWYEGCNHGSVKAEYV